MFYGIFSRHYINTDINNMTRVNLMAPPPPKKTPGLSLHPAAETYVSVDVIPMDTRVGDGKQ